MTAKIDTLPHQAHAGFICTGTVVIDGYESLDGYVTWCEDCTWSEAFLAKNHSNMLVAWNEAARARDIHHDTHTKEIA